MKPIRLLILLFAAIVFTVAFAVLRFRSTPVVYVVGDPESAPALSPPPRTPEPTPPRFQVTPEITATPVPEPTQIPFSHYAPTVAMEFRELVGDDKRYEMPAGYPAPDTYYTIVDKTHQVVMVYGKDENGAYTVPVRYMLCSTGKRTPVGKFKMKRYRVRFGYFQNDKTYGQYWSLINGRIYFHSMLYRERNEESTYIKETYDLLGTPASHGCIRLTVPDARFIYYHLAYGAEVEIREGDSNDLQTKSIRENLILPQSPTAQADFSGIPFKNTDCWNIDDVPLEVPYEAGTQKGQE